MLNVPSIISYWPIRAANVRFGLGNERAAAWRDARGASL